MYDMNLTVRDLIEDGGEYTVKGILLPGGKLPKRFASLGPGATLEFIYGSVVEGKSIRVDLAGLRDGATPIDGQFSLDDFEGLDIVVESSEHTRFGDALSQESMNLKFRVRGK